MSHRTSFLLGALLIGVNLLRAVSAAEALAAPIRKGDLVSTTWDGTQVKSEDNVLMTLPADTWLVAADVHDDWVLVRVRKEGTEVTGFVQAESLRRAAMVKYSNPQGFSLQHPESWKVASAEQRAAAIEKVKPLVEKLPSRPRLPPYVIYVPGNAESDFQQNINCVTAPGLVGETDAASAKRAANELREGFKKMGMPVAKVHTEVIEAGNRKAVSSRLDARLKEVDEPVRQWQVVIPGKSQGYIFTCSALASDFWRFEPVFAAVIQSIEVDVGGAKP